MNLGRTRVLLITMITLLVVSATRTAHAGVVPFGWPEGWSDLQEAGTVTRFAPQLRTAFCELSQILQVVWLADHGGRDANIVFHREIDLGEGRFSGPARIVYEMQSAGRIGDVDFELRDEGGVYLVWTERTEDRIELLAGGFTLNGGAWAPDWIESLFSTDSSVVDPRVAREGDRVYLAWSDSRRGVLNICLSSLTPDGPREEGYIHASDRPSVNPFVFSHAGRTYVAWVQRFGDVARQLLIVDLEEARAEPWIISYTTGRSREITPSLHVHHDRKDLVIVNRDAGRDRLAYIDLSALLESPPGGEHDVSEIGTYLVSGSIVGAEPMRGATDADELVFAYTVVDRSNHLSVSMGVARGEDEVRVQEMTPTVSGASRPVIYGDNRGHRHLLFLTVQPDMSFAIQYMNTVEPAAVSYWNVIGLDVKAPLVSLPIRFAAVGALALATMLPNVVPIIIGAVLVFLAGGFLGTDSYWIPGLVLGGFTLVWAWLLPEPFIYFAAPPASRGDFIAAVIICFVMITALARCKGSWRGEPLSVISFDFLWFLWFFMFTIIRV